MLISKQLPGAETGEYLQTYKENYLLKAYKLLNFNNLKSIIKNWHDVYICGTRSLII